MLLILPITTSPRSRSLYSMALRSSYDTSMNISNGGMMAHGSEEQEAFVFSTWIGIYILSGTFSTCMFSRTCERNKHLQLCPPLHLPPPGELQSSTRGRIGCQPSGQQTAQQVGCSFHHPSCTTKKTTLIMVSTIAGQWVKLGQHAAWFTFLMETLEMKKGLQVLFGTYLSYEALERSDITAWKSGFSFCSHFTLLSRDSPWNTRQCFNNSRSISAWQCNVHIIWLQLAARRYTGMWQVQSRIYAAIKADFKPHKIN